MQSADKERMAQSAVSAVVGGVSGLAVQETSLLCGVQDEVVFLKEELARLPGLLKDLHDKPKPWPPRSARSKMPLKMHVI